MVRAQDRQEPTATRTVRRRAVYYPSGDGKPLAESYEHGAAMWDLMYRLQRHFRGRDDVHLGINSFIYYVEGDPQRRVAPDVYVVLGARPRPQAERDSYKLWEEGVPPTIVFEFTSPSTRRTDLNAKREIYAGMGVREYVLYDPKRQYLRPPLQGFVLHDGVFIERTAEAGGDLISDVLHARITPVEMRLDLFDVTTGERWLTDHEHEQLLRAREEARANQEKDRADRAEAELRALRAQLEALRGNGHGTNGAPHA